MNVRFLAAVLAVAGFCLSANAQDYIVTSQGERIAAKVVEVGPDDLLYKKWGNAEGPNYRIPLSDVSRVEYQNGEVETYDVEDNNSGMVRRLRGQVGGHGADLSYYYEYPSGPVYRNGSALFIKDAHVNAGAVLDPDLYRQWRTGVNMKLAGMTMWVIGATFAGGGLSMLLSPGDAAPYLIAGGVLIAVGVPLHVCGNVKLDDVVQEHNSRRNLAGGFSPEISFGVQRYGLGLALKF